MYIRCAIGNTYQMEGKEPWLIGHGCIFSVLAIDIFLFVTMQDG